MANENATPPADSSHDDLSNPGPERNHGVPEFGNESHDRNDDGPSGEPDDRIDIDEAGVEDINGETS